jgi:hypothetical protein
LINDLYNLGDWDTGNGIIRVRIGAYDSQCTSVLTDPSTEQLNPRIDEVLPNVGELITPGYTNPGYFNIEDFDVTGFQNGWYCVYIQAGWWGPAFGTSTWKANFTAVTGCDGVSTVSKDAAFYVSDHTSGTFDINVSQYLPHGNWPSSGLCP